jgi:electron transfer flavoprotein alpha subunit
MSSLVLVQCEDGRPVNGALAALKAAQGLGPMMLLACGSGAEQAAGELAAMAGVQRVFALEGDDALRAEAMAPVVITLRSRATCSHIVAPANAWTRSLVPRIAALLDVMAVTDVVKIIDAQTFVRPVHAGAALMTLRAEGPVHVLTVRISAFEAPQTGGGARAQVEVIELPPSSERSALLVERHRPQQEGAVELIGARVVLSGGRGTGSAQGFESLRPLAKLLGAAIGASRAAVDAGYAAADEQVGQTGKSVAPELYIAMGISGAVQHWAGMKDSKVIVAVNKDPEAPIFQFADYGLAADLFEVLPALQAAVAALPPRT